MTIEADLNTILTAICPRVSPDFADVCTARPYVTYQQIGGEVPQFIDRTIPSLKNAHFQINVWSDSRIEAQAIAESIELAMLGATVFQASAMGAAVSEADPDMRRYGTRQDFSVWAPR